MWHLLIIFFMIFLLPEPEQINQELRQDAALLISQGDITEEDHGYKKITRAVFITEKLLTHKPEEKNRQTGAILNFIILNKLSDIVQLPFVPPDLV